VLAHFRPEADIPVVQLSINALKPLDYHVALGAKLDALRERGILILGSGNVVHNLRRIDPNQPDTGFDWAERFDDAVVEQLAENPTDILKLAEHPDYQFAVPTPDHFMPMLYIAGIAAASGERMGAMVRGYAMGSLSMTCYDVGAETVCREESGAARLPEGVPADQSNI
jgi:4,5-DOPA dioxygenase extradiol